AVLDAIFLLCLLAGCLGPVPRDFRASDPLLSPRQTPPSPPVRRPVIVCSRSTDEVTHGVHGVAQMVRAARGHRFPALSSQTDGTEVHLPTSPRRTRGAALSGDHHQGHGSFAGHRTV